MVYKSKKQLKKLGNKQFFEDIKKYIKSSHSFYESRVPELKVLANRLHEEYDLKEFYKELINNNTDDLSIISLENELKAFEKKYTDFLKFEDAKNIVNNTFSKLYNDKKDEAENLYYNFIDNNNNNINNIMIDEY
jgi:hypothetical protein